MSTRQRLLARPRLTVAAAALALCALAAIPPTRADSPPRMIAPGVSYRTLERPGPLRIHIIDIDPKQQYISLACATAGDAPRRLKVSDIASAHTYDNPYAVAAVNGDYFNMGGDCDGMLCGLNINRGRLMSAGGGRSALLLLEGGRVAIAAPSLDAWLEMPGGNRVAINAINQPRGRRNIVLYTSAFGSSTQTPPSGREVALRALPEPLELGKLYDATVIASTQAVGSLQLSSGTVVVSAPGPRAQALAGLKVGDAVKLKVDLMARPEGRIVEAVGGGPTLVRSGSIVAEWAAEDFTATHALRRHPRTAAGIAADGRALLVAVDGRQMRSIGMTLAELARLMLDLGCRDAVNLDGGGSTTMWVRGEVVNSPSGGRERPVADALLVTSSAPHGPPKELRVTPQAIAALPSYRATIKVKAAQDQYYNPVDIKVTGLGWGTEGEIGTISVDGEFTAADVSQTVTGAVKVYCAGMVARIPVTVYPRPPKLELAPQTATTAPGGRVQFALRALDDNGSEILFDPGQVEWQADEAAGGINERGALTVGRGPTGDVTARLLGVEARARVVCAATTVAVEGFEKTGTCAAYAWPREVPASCALVTAPVRDGKRAARLKYDFSTTEASRAAHLELKRSVGRAVALRAWVYGDGKGHWLRAKITDAQGQSFNLDFLPLAATGAQALLPGQSVATTQANDALDDAGSGGALARNGREPGEGSRVDWTGWREVTAAIPPDAQPPIRWDTIYVSEFQPERRDVGALVFDLLRAEVAPGDSYLSRPVDAK